jgi:hypothetical protein
MGRNLLVLGGSIATIYCHPAYMSVYGGDYQPEYVDTFLKNFALTAFYEVHQGRFSKITQTSDRI